VKSVDVAILGGGLTGLTVAHELVQNGLSVAVLESLPEAGGLARTLVHGDYRFDLGGHRFHSDDQQILDWLDRLLGDRVLMVPRLSRIRIRGRWVHYPLVPKEAITAFGPFEATRMALSYMGAAFARIARKPDRNFKEWVTARFGRRLFEIYFRPYTEKVWGLDTERISAAWAAERLSTGSLRRTLIQSVRRKGPRAKTLVSQFRYFPSGIGELPDALARVVTDSERGDIHLATSVTGLARAGDGWDVTANGEDGPLTIHAGRVVSTIPITALPALLEDGPERETATEAASHLTYRGVICVMAGVRQPSLTDDTWIYFPEKEIVFGRLHEPRNWSVDMAPEGKTSFCVEIFASPGDETWRRSDADISGACVHDLERVGLLRADDVETPLVSRVPGAYPIWEVGYEDHLGRLRQVIEGLDGLHLVGRTGSFAYLNMDGVIPHAWEMADRLLGRDDIRRAPEMLVVP
jgi:protoporphyrinogen oxidase